MGEGKSGVLIPLTQRLFPLLVALGLGLVGVDISLNVRPAVAKATSKVALKVRRYPERVDVVVNGVGPAAIATGCGLVVHSPRIVRKRL